MQIGEYLLLLLDHQGNSFEKRVRNYLEISKQLHQLRAVLGGPAPSDAEALTLVIDVYSCCNLDLAGSLYSCVTLV